MLYFAEGMISPRFGAHQQTIALVSRCRYNRFNHLQRQNMEFIMSKKNTTKKICAFAAALTLMACPIGDMASSSQNMSSSVAITASATQDRSYNFSRNYTLTGNGAVDVVRVAAAQNGKTGANLGYSEQWCADFATDSARLSGVSSSVIPYTYSGRGSCIQLYHRMLNNCNAKVVSTPKVGDFVFFDWSGKKNTGNLHHVAIVSSVSGNKVTVIGGNQGSAKSLSSRKVSYVTYNITDRNIARYVRPNYTTTGNTNPPVGNCYPQYTGSSSSIVTALKTVGVDSSFSFRAKIAVANGIVSNTSQYKGSSSQNRQMLSLLKQGKLKKVGTTTVTTKSYTIQSSAGVKVRKGAGTGYAQTGGLAKGSVVYYDQTKTANGYTWLHITGVKTASGSWGSFNGYWVAKL